MTSFKAMEKALQATGLYQLTQTTRLYAELKAYEAGLQIVADAFNEVEQESFIPTASSYGLTKREALYGLENNACTQEERKNMLLLRGAITTNSFQMEGIKKALLSCGVQAEITESVDTQSITIHVTSIKGNQTQAKVTNAITAFLPAHLDATITFASE